LGAGGVPPTDGLQTIGTTGTAGNGAFAGCTSLKTFGTAGTNLPKEGVVAIPGYATTNIQALSFEGCTSISAVEIISSVATTYLGGAFKDCTNLKILSFTGTIPTAVTFDAANAVPSVTEVIWDIGLLSAAADFSGLDGLRKLTVTKELAPVVIGATFPAASTGFDTLEIRGESQRENAAIFSSLPATVKNVIIGTGPAPTNAALAIGHPDPASLFRSVVNNITFTGAIGFLGGDFFGTLSGVTVNINDTPSAMLSAANSGSAIKIVNVGPNTPVFTAAIFDSTALEAINVNDGNKDLRNGNPGDGVLYKKVNNALDTLIQYPIAKVGTRYDITEGVKTIGASAFGNTAGLATITIPKSVTKIEATAISNVAALRTLNYNAINSENATAFPVNISNLVIGEEVISIPANFIGANVGLYEITIPKSVAAIGNTAFTGWAADPTTPAPPVKKVVNFNAVALTSESVFEDVTPAIDEIYIGNDVTNIPSGTFQGAGIVGLLLGTKKVQNIGSNAFNACLKLVEVDIPDTCLTVGASAFAGCTVLKSVKIRGNPSLGATSFPAGEATTLEPPGGVYSGPGWYTLFETATAGEFDWMKTNLSD
jgi:hypothetical protein